MLLLDAPITMREVMTHEEVPLADVFREVGRFLIGRDDVVLFGAQAARRGKPKELSDRLDVRRLLLALPELKCDGGAVSKRLGTMGAPDATLALWREIVREPNVDDDDDATW